MQFGFSCSGINPQTSDTPADRKIYAAVKPGAPFIGQPNDPLCIAIARMQDKYGGIQDGIVSTLQPNGPNPFKYEGRWAHLRTLTYLLMDIYDTNLDIWPRLNANTVCPPAVKTAIKAIFQFR